jgi:hypothetical protein
MLGFRVKSLRLRVGGSLGGGAHHWSWREGWRQQAGPTEIAWARRGRGRGGDIRGWLGQRRGEGNGVGEEGGTRTDRS